MLLLNSQVCGSKKGEEAVSILVCDKSFCYYSAYSELAPINNERDYSGNVLYHVYVCAACSASGSSSGKFGGFLVYEESKISSSF